MQIPEGPLGDVHLPRDILSRANRQSERVMRLLKSDAWEQVGGSHSGMRSYAIGLAELITRMVKQSESADAAEFDVILSVVDDLGTELATVMYKLLEF